MRLLLRQRLAALLCIFAVWSGLCAVVLHLEHPGHAESACHHEGQEHHHDADDCPICHFIVQAVALLDVSPVPVVFKVASLYCLPTCLAWACTVPVLFSPRGPPSMVQV